METCHDCHEEAIIVQDDYYVRDSDGVTNIVVWFCTECSNTWTEQYETTKQPLTRPIDLK